MDKTKYYVLNKKAVPEVLLKVVEVKHLLATRKGMTIGEAAESAEVLFINIKMTFSLSMKMKRGRQSPSSCRWRIFRDCWRRF